MDEDAEPQTERLPLPHDHLALLALGEGVLAERVGDEHAVVSGVEPRALEVLRVRHQGDAHGLAVDLA